MAPEAANQKRKRGRPAIASRDDQGASQHQLTLTNSGTLGQPAVGLSAVKADDDPRPRKRGRAARTEPEPLPEPEAPDGNGDAPPKRKRGRPSLTRESDDEENRHGEPDLPATKLRPKKRGHQSPSQDRAQHTRPRPAAATSTVTEAEEPSPKRRGRPAKKGSKSVGQRGDGADEEADDENEAPSGKRRNGRNGNAGNTSQVSSQTLLKPAETKKSTKRTAEAGRGDDSSLGRKGRDRRNVAGGAGVAQTAEKQDEPATGESFRRGKEVKKGQPVAEDASAASPETAPTSKPKAKKRGQPPAKDVPAREAQDVSRKKTGKPGRPSLTRQNTQIADAPRSRGRRPKEQHPEEEQAQEETEDESRRPDQSNDKTLQQERRAQALQTQPEDRAPTPDETSPPFRQLTTRTRRVPREVIDAKWSPLDPASISSIGDLLNSASRPVLLRITNLHRHTEATAALNAVSKRLRSKLSRGLPFPPATTAVRREDELQFERAVDGIQSLEAQLDPLLHGVALLKKEKERAKRELEREYKVLHSLSANARAEGKERRDQMRKMHVLVPNPKRDEDNDAEDLRQTGSTEQRAGKTFVGLENDELESLAGQIGSHMESMKGNLQQIEGVAPAIAESRAALKMALMPHLDPSSYEQVLLG